MNAPAQITVVARWQPEGEAYDEVLAILAALRPRSLAEPGCLGYEVYQSLDVPRTILLLEHYRDEAALDAHRESPHYQSLVVQRALPLLKHRQVEVLRTRYPD